MDLMKNHSQEVWISNDETGYTQYIVFKDMPSYCVHCRKYGHSVDICYVKHPELHKLHKQTRGRSVKKEKGGKLQGKEDHTAVELNRDTWSQYVITQHPQNCNMEDSTSVINSRKCQKESGPVDELLMWNNDPMKGQNETEENSTKDDKNVEENKCCDYTQGNNDAKINMNQVMDDSNYIKERVNKFSQDGSNYDGEDGIATVGAVSSERTEGMDIVFELQECSNPYSEKQEGISNGGEQGEIIGYMQVQHEVAEMKNKDKHAQNVLQEHSTVSGLDVLQRVNSDLIVNTVDVTNSESVVVVYVQVTNYNDSVLAANNTNWQFNYVLQQVTSMNSFVSSCHQFEPMNEVFDFEGSQALKVLSDHHSDYEDSGKDHDIYILPHIKNKRRS